MIEITNYDTIVQVISPEYASAIFKKLKWGVEDFDTSNTVVTYVGQISEDGQWAVVKVYEDTEIHVKYATVKNNPTYTYQTAWANRTSLNYSDYNEAF